MAAHKYRVMENAGIRYRLMIGAYQAKTRGDEGLKDFLHREYKYMIHKAFGGYLSAPRSGLTTVRRPLHHDDTAGLQDTSSSTREKPR